MDAERKTQPARAETGVRDPQAALLVLRDTGWFYGG